MITVPYFIVGILGLGMALAFYSVDAQSPTSRALAAVWGLLGAIMLLNIPADLGLTSRFWRMTTATFSLLEGAIIISAMEWVIRVKRTEGDGETGRVRGELVLRAAQAMGALYGLTGVIFARARLDVWQSGRYDLPIYYLFALPFGFSILLGVAGGLRLFRSGIDPVERIRLNALTMAVPFLGIGGAVPVIWKPAAIAIGEVVFLAGAIRYHVLKGQRGQFLARFVSPQVAKLVQERGLSSLQQHQRLQLSAIACDLRGFTAFTETAAPEEVMQLLQQYYETVGAVVTEFGGSIKDFAGDGILSLVGAPLACADHAERALRIALTMRDRSGEFISRWQKLGLELGLGVGVASGFATVGMINSSGRVEYTAVGPAVNLASRLCNHAAAGQVLIDQRTIGLLGDGEALCRFDSMGTAELKGFARPVSIFAAVTA